MPGRGDLASSSSARCCAGRDPATLDVVVVEDVHWADEATVDLLRFLGRRLRTSRRS